MLRPVKIWFFGLILITPWAGSAAVGCPEVDINGDCKVNFEDLQYFVDDWLGPPNCPANFNGDEKVDMADFAELAKYWLVQPTTGSLKVILYPQKAIIAGAKWRVDGGAWRDSGYIETALSADIHTVEFSPIQGWLTPGDRAINIEAGQLTTIHSAYTQSVVISEFMAINDSTLADEEGRFRDWIEIYNSTSTWLDLSGWYLTDNDANLTKWQFPDGVSIDPSGFLVVFASGQDRRNPAGPLHTNFKLDGDGEYLALVRPDANTIAHEYYPTYPEQLRDISYGLAQSASTLVTTGAAVYYHVPTPDDAGADWSSVDFDDSQWDSGKTGIGFGDICGIYGLHYEYYEGSWITLPDFDALKPVKQGTIANFDISPRNRNDYFAFRFTGFIQVPEGGVYTFYTTSDDGSQLYIGDTLVVDNDNLHSMVEKEGKIFLNAGIHPITVTFFERTGEQALVVRYEGPGISKTEISDDALCITPVTNDLQNQMQNINASLWIRIEFGVEDPEFFDRLTLRVKYEDGFVAYLNGVEVARRNAPATLQWNSAAASDRPIENSWEFEDIELVAYLDLLRPKPEKNVLAIHALNNSASDDQFLISPELVAANNQPVPQYFTTPTPGTYNVPGAKGRVSKVWFSLKRGIYEPPPGLYYWLRLSTEMTDAQIRYTLDGSTPTMTHGYLYDDSAPIKIDKTTVIRAVAVKPGWLSSEVQTQSYIFPVDVIHQSDDGGPPGPNWPAYSVNSQVIDYGMDPCLFYNPYIPSQIKKALKAIPTISLVTDLDNLFDESIGIYVNARNDGRAWERPCSVELIYPPNPRGPGFPDLVKTPDGKGGYRWELPRQMRGGFQIDAGLRIRGGYSRSGSNPKHAFRLFFRSEYGPAKLTYPLFADEGVDEFDNVDLRCAQNYSWSFHRDSRNTMVREVFSRDLQGEMGHPYTRSRYYHLYINGHYWGVYQTQERHEASYAASYMGGDKEDYDVVKTEWNIGRRMAATDGNMKAYRRLYDAAIAGFSSNAAYFKIQGLNPDGTPNPDYEKLLDVDNLIDFMIIEYYTGDRDGPGSRYGNKPNNTWGIYNRVNPDGFKWMQHDSEHSLGTGENNLVTPLTSAGEQWEYFNPHWLHEQLANQNAEYRLHFADHVQKHLFNGGLLTPEVAIARINKRAAQINQAIIAESVRWGDGRWPDQPARTSADWLNAVDYVRYWISYRNPTLLNQFRGQGWFPSIDAPSFNINGSYKHGGYVSAGDRLTITNPNGSGTIYYTLDGHDPRRMGGSVNTPYAKTYSGAIELRHSVVAKARIKTEGTWSALNEAIYAIGPVKENLRITEIMYHPQDTGDPNEEFIELKNIGPQKLNLNLVRFTKGIHFTFPNLELPAGQYVVVVKNQTAFQTRYPAFPGLIAGEYTGSLDNAGERIRLEDATGQAILEFKYKDGWRKITDGQGYSLTIINPHNPDPVSWAEKDCWRASAYVGGSPGADDTGIIPEPGAVVFNEILAHSHGDAPDWIELYNTTDEAINIGGWFLSDSDKDDPNRMKYRIADPTVIAPEGFLVFYENTDFNNPGGDPGCLIPFALSENGDQVYLRSGLDALGRLTGYYEKEDFGASETNVAFGRYRKSTGTYNFVPMSKNTPDPPYENAYPKVGPVVINEIMYNPPSGNQNEEFIELYNITDSEVTLYRQDKAEPWKFTGGIDYTFPDNPKVAIPAYGYILVVKNPTVFLAKYGDPGVPVLGPYNGKLSNAGEKLELSMPGDVDEFGIRQYIRIDRVNYSDGSHHEDFDYLQPPIDPWSIWADGNGASLSRIYPQYYGNDPNNWAAEMPSPGY